MPAIDKTGSSDIDNTSESTSTSTSDTSTTTNGKVGKDAINASATLPFIASLPPSATESPNYASLKAARVGAMMFFGGELFNNYHSKKVYMNPSLDRLVKQCNEAGMPYGLYVNVRARNEIEADEECRALYYVVAHCPPILGVWLSIQAMNTVSTNDSILEVYYKYLTKWGLGQRCGLYVDEYQLANISWYNFQDRFYLWMIKSLDASEVDDELLDPEMFEVPG